MSVAGSKGSGRSCSPVIGSAAGTAAQAIAQPACMPGACFSDECPAAFSAQYIVDEAACGTAACEAPKPSIASGDRTRLRARSRDCDNAGPVPAQIGETSSPVMNGKKGCSGMDRPLCRRGGVPEWSLVDLGIAKAELLQRLCPQNAGRNPAFRPTPFPLAGCRHLPKARLATQRLPLPTCALARSRARH